MSSQTEDIGVIVLAAGDSTRLGRPKQLVEFDGGTLLGHVVTTAIAVSPAHTVVVLGASAAVVRPDVELFAATVVMNNGWKEGIAGSIRLGVETITSTNPNLRAVIMLTCDQPRVTVHLLREMISCYDLITNRIVACEYGDGIGIPALFDRAYFRALRGLRGGNGGKKILLGNLDQIIGVPFPGGAFDVDSERDLDRL